MRKAIRAWDTANYWKSRAAGAIRAAKHKELPGVRSRRIKRLESELRKIRAEQAGVGAASDLQATDERTRQNLISLAQSGIDTGTAAQLASGQMSAAAETAKAGTQQASVGRLFDNLSQAYLTNAVLKARYPNGLPGQPQGGPSFGNLFTGKTYAGTVTN